MKAGRGFESCPLPANKKGGEMYLDSLKWAIEKEASPEVICKIIEANKLSSWHATVVIITGLFILAVMIVAIAYILWRR